MTRLWTKNQVVGELKNINQEIAEKRNKLNKIADIQAKSIKQFISGKISEDDKQVVIDNPDELEDQQTVQEAKITYALNVRNMRFICTPGGATLPCLLASG